MKIKLKYSTHGSVLLVTLLTATIIGIALASYLALVSNQNLSVSRSLAWNSVMPVVESGVEEALSQIFYNSYTNLQANSWTLSLTDGLYHKTRTVGTDGSYYEVSISPVDPPVIVSKGYVVPPVSGYSQLGMILATAVGGSPSGSTPTYVARTVQVKTQKMRGSGVGLTARNKIIFSGGGSLDSFSSADGPYVSTNRHAGGKAVSNYKLADGIHVDTAHIYGSAAVGAGGTVTVAGGSVGDLTWYPGHSGAQAGSTNDYASVEFFDESAPFTSGFTPVHGSYPVGGTNYGWQFGDGNYYYSGTLQFADTAIVTGHAVLYVTQACKTSGSGFIYLAPGASMQVYVGTEFNVSGSGVVNGTQKASNFGVHGLNTCTKVVISGSSAFIGTVNAPYAAFTFSGSAGAFGSFIANTITISGGAAVHYDEALDTSGNGYVVSAWNEISN